ncbi:MAG TPA: hypothetical protein VFQ61_30590 [Polyangiaceae bacterium]|nr:hypothetical protein [Polyangiaceae bacterium]
MTGAWLNPAGGLRYHARALRYSRTLWDPFRWALGEWLLGFQPPERTLVIVGPSAGYNLQPFFLERFERVIGLEPDPIARYLFRRRIERAPLDRRPQLSFIAEDQLLGEPERFLRLLETLGDCALLFSNIIGQMRVLVEADVESAPRLTRIREVIRSAVRDRSFASFHDRVSGPIPPAFEPPMHGPSRLSDAEVIDLYDDSALSEQTPLLDHFTGGFFPPDLPHSYFVWQLEPGIYHLIEAVSRTLGAGAATGAKPEP